MKVLPAVVILLLIATFLSADAGVDTFGAFRRAAKDPGLRREIVTMARKALDDTVRRGVVALPGPTRHPLLARNVGVFVTLVANGEVRGCMGALDPVETNVGADIVRAATLAATEDRRYSRIFPSELDRIVPVVSIVGPRRRVQSPSQLDPLRLGLLVERDGRGGVLLPGEALSAAWQVAGCKAKAGIPPSSPAAMYVFPTVVFSP